ncbi:MAG: MHYT domain-containing protein [Pseudomonadota bacterium]|nr:MHYT domain-containing protein [Pseudomonadota bacterium]
MDLGSYFSIGQDASLALTAQYDLTLVAASYLIAGLAGFSFIRLLVHVAEQPNGPGRTVWQIAGALIMGLGVWSMHFVGMLAYRLPIPVGFDATLTAASVVPAIAGSFVAMNLVGNRTHGTRALMVGAIAFGGGIGAMHYTGMAAMQVNAIVRYDVILFSASIAVAVALGLLALSIAKWIVRRGDELQISASVLAAGIVGFAVAGMHYTAMASTLCFSATVPNPVFQAYNPDILAALTGVATVTILATAGGALAYDRRLAHEVLQREAASRRAMVSDRRLSEAMETLADDFAIFDASDRLVFWNSHFREAFTPGVSDPSGMQFEAIMRDHLNRTYASDPDVDVMDRAGEIMEHHASPNAPLMWQPFPKEWALVRQRHTSDGGTVFLSTDITDVKRAELQAERANRAKTEFLHSMSHELRTPLNGVIGIAEMLLTVDSIRNDPVRSTEYLTDIKASGEHLLTLVSDILDMAAIERGSHQMALETFDIVKSISEIARTMRSAHGPDVSITFDVPDEPVRITADRRAFRQVIINLISNGIQHGGGQVSIEISPEGPNDPDEEQFIRVIVSDTGPGMPGELLDVVGQPFPHAHSPQIRSSSTGSGLGLAIVSQLMHLNAGKFEIFNGEMAGTRTITSWKMARINAKVELAGD